MIARAIMLAFFALVTDQMSFGSQRAFAANDPAVAERAPGDSEAVLVDKEMIVGSYYMEKRNFIGAVNRFKIVITQYRTSERVPEALAHLTESYLALGIVQEAQTAAAVLCRHFPNSRWTTASGELLGQSGLEPREEAWSWISKAFAADPESVDPRRCREALRPQ